MKTWIEIEKQIVAVMDAGHELVEAAAEMPIEPALRKYVEKLEETLIQLADLPPPPDVWCRTCSGNGYIDSTRCEACKGTGAAKWTRDNY